MSPEQIAGLLEVVRRSAEPGRSRRDALNQLGLSMIGSPDARRILQDIIAENRLIYDPDGDVASLAIHFASLYPGPQGDPLPNEALWILVDDPRANVQIHALMALERRQDPMVEAVLRRWASDCQPGDFRHFYAVQALRGGAEGDG
jgi:hypothetical protein